MIITLIRHSKTKFSTEVPITCWGLTEEGITLADNLSSTDEIKRLDVVYSSFETKALETALHLAKPNAVHIKVDNHFTEITSFTKKVFPEFEKYAKDFFEGRKERYFGGESKEEALLRFNNALEEIVKTEAKEGTTNLGVVTHGAILTLFSSQYCNIPIWNLHTRIEMPDVALFDWDKKKFIKSSLNYNWWEEV